MIVKQMRDSVFQLVQFVDSMVLQGMLSSR